MISTEQYTRDQSWLRNLPTLEEINRGLSELQAALDRAWRVLDHLDKIRSADPGWNPRLPGPSRFLMTDSGKRADRQIFLFNDLPRHSWTATDYIRRRPDGSKLKYPLKQWATLAKRINRWCDLNESRP